MSSEYRLLARNSNQARGIAEYAIDFCQGRLPGPADSVLRRTELFHLDSVGCAIAALACHMNAPIVLRREALEFPHAEGAPCFGSLQRVHPEKAVLANCAAVRELDANGTNFGFNPALEISAASSDTMTFIPWSWRPPSRRVGMAQALNAMVCLDEIRGRLAEVFALKDHKIDHVVHGAIASAAVYGAIVGASAAQIESALGLVVAHHIPFRAIRAGHQLSDSKGASAAISAEAAVSCMRRAMRGFIGPADVFRNPQAIFCLFEPPAEPDTAPFDLQLATAGDDFAVMGMHFKLGLYEHQSAGAIQGLMDLLAKHPQLLSNPEQLKRVKITIYEPAFGIIGDPAKRDPRTRQSADHSMVYIIATLLRKALQSGQHGWAELMLLPEDYDEQALFDPLTRELMQRIEFEHGGKDYDDRYPDGIPTTIELHHDQLGTVSSGLIMYPEGHARNESGRRESLLVEKFRRLAGLGVDDPDQIRERMTPLSEVSAEQLGSLYQLPV